MSWGDPTPSSGSTPEQAIKVLEDAKEGVEYVC